MTHPIHKLRPLVPVLPTAMLALALAATPARALTPPSLSSVQVRDLAGQAVSTMVPGDTMYVDVALSDLDGFRDVAWVKIIPYYKSYADRPDRPYSEASFTWTRGASTSWVRDYPAGSSWQVLPDLCTVDLGTNAITPQTVRFAIVVGKIAAFSNSGEWRIRATAKGATDPTTSAVATVSSLGMANHTELTNLAVSSQFVPGRPGDSALPLGEPSSGTITFSLLTNADFHIQAAGTPLVGETTPSYVIPTGGPIRLDLSTGSHITLGAGYTNASGGEHAMQTETPVTYGMRLSLDMPTGIALQRYLGTMNVRIRADNDGHATDQTVSMLATVLGGGFAADSARAEVQPQTVFAGTVSQPFTASLQPYASLGSTGINLVRIGLPAGYSGGRVTAVRSNGTPVGFLDQSRTGIAEARLVSAVTTAPLLQVDFTANAPAIADSNGADFQILFDDTTTTVPAQGARPGDVTGPGDGAGWHVVVVPGPAVTLDVQPPSATTWIDSTVVFTATAFDAGHNPATSTVVWGVEGGIGTVDGTGRFRATSPGTGRVIAKSGSVSDTAVVTVNSIPTTLRAGSAWQGSRTVRPGDAPGEVFRFNVVNPTVLPETLTTVRFANRTIGPGTSAQLDSDWGPLSLSAARLDGSGAAGTPVALGSVSMTAGEAVFSGLAFRLAPGDSATLLLYGSPALNARDSDELDVRISSATSLTFRPAASTTGTWPIDPAGTFPVDGMTAGQIAVHAVGSRTVTVGLQRTLLLDFTLPANGYSTDQLRRVDVVNLGTAVAGTDIARLEAWSDDGDGTLDITRDTRLGALVFTGDRWQVTGLSHAVPLGGRRLFITGDIAELANEGRTIRLSLPTAPDVALGMVSGNSGPIDAAVSNPSEQVITTVDRITLSAQPIAPASLRPGRSGAPLLTLIASNTYTTDRRMTGLAVANATTGSGSAAQLDDEFTQAVLRLDGDDDGILGAPDVDPVLATAPFSGGRASFTGFAWDLPAGKTRRLFVTADVSVHDAADGDQLSARLERALDVSFETPTAVAAAWPVSSGARWSVDGMIAEQVSNLGAPPLTLGPNDGPYTALDVIVPANGYAADVLQGLHLVNLGTAGPGDIAELRLWRDGGDGVFQGPNPGDDLDLGPLTLFNGNWQTPLLAESVAPGGARLFVSLKVGSAPLDSATVRLEIPKDGIAMASGNSGPLDTVIVNPEAQLLSTAPLLASLRVTPAASVPGQSLTVSMTVRNRSAERIQGIAPSPLSVSGAATAAFVSGPSPASLDLDPGEESAFTWTYTSGGTGSLRFEGSASGTGQGSGLSRRSLSTASNSHQVFSRADSLSLYPLQSMPFSVNRGQSGVVPMSLTFRNDGSETSSDVRLRTLRLRLESETGAGVVPADLISSITVREGSDIYLTKTSLETSGNTIDLTLATPVLITRTEPVTVSVRLDIAAGTVVPNFRVVITDASLFAAEDAVSGAPVAVRLQSGAFPVRTGLARVVASATRLDVSGPPPSLQRVGAGQSGAVLGRVQFENPGVTGLSSDVRLGEFAVRLARVDGTPITDPQHWLTTVRLVGPFSVLAEHHVAAADSGGVLLVLSPLMSIPVNSPIELRIEADLDPAVPAAMFRMELADSARVDARDANTGERVPASIANAAVLGDTLRVEARADSLRAAGTALFPASVPAGRAAVNALRVLLRHPGGAGVAAIRATSVSLHALDDRRTAIAPNRYLDRVRARWNGSLAATEFDPPATAGALVLTLPDSRIEPGATDTLLIEVDIRSDAPVGQFELLLDGDDLAASDANLASAVTLAPDSGATFPVGSGLVRVEPPSRVLAASLESRLPAALAHDGSEVPVGRLRLRNTAGSGSGSIQVEGLVLEAGGSSPGSLAIGSIAQRFVARVGGVRVGSSDVMTSDSTTASIAFTNPLDIPAGAAVDVEVGMVPAPAAAAERFRIAIDGRDVRVVQPANSLLSVGVQPESGETFPMWTQSAGFAASDLRESYANFPNPFAAGREATTFLYFMPQPGRVSLRVWTARGERVRTLLEDAAVAAGVRQADQWDGRNGRGDAVDNGVYFAELSVQYDDGTRARILRKVAVVR